MNPITSINSTSLCLFTNTDFLIPGDSEEAIMDFKLLDGYFYITGYSLSTGLTNGKSDFMIYKISQSDGSKVWAKYYGSSLQEKAYSIDVTSSYLVTAGTSTSTGYDDALILKLSTSDGSLQFSKLFGDTGIQVFTNVKIINNEIVVLGYLVASGSGNFADIFL